jgi:hypothetical protein
VARHFVIAAPAAAVCLDKLIQLDKALDPQKAKLVFSIHDGYLLSTTKPQIQEVATIAKKVLESESSLCPGLKIGTKCEAGKNLTKLVKVY